MITRGMREECTARGVINCMGEPLGQRRAILRAERSGPWAHQYPCWHQGAGEDKTKKDVRAAAVVGRFDGRVAALVRIVTSATSASTSAVKGSSLRVRRDQTTQCDCIVRRNRTVLQLARSKARNASAD